MKRSTKRKPCLKLSVLDRGLHYGDGVFESLRTFGGKPFMLKEHLKRLERSASVIGMRINNLQLTINNKVLKLLKLNGYKESYIKIIITRGEMKAHGISPKNVKGKPTIIILVQPLRDLPDSAYQKGWRAIISSVVRADFPLNRIKSLNYLQMLLAKMEADKAGVDEALVRDEKGHILEATTSNVFIVKNGVVITPPTSAPILPGTMRAWFLDVCQRTNIEYRILNIEFRNLFLADECFITNSGLGIMPIVKIGKHRIGNGKMGMITRKLWEEFRKL